MRGFTTQATRPRRRSHRQTKDLHLAIVAAAYATSRAEKPTAPREGTYRYLKAIGHHYARSTIGPLITKARAAHMLTPTANGKAGGDLTDNARHILTKAAFQAPWYLPTTPTPFHPTPAA
jgi:hypothetical protein